jgi:predicted CXXCH cytochrome family protein
LTKKILPALCLDCHEQKDLAAVKGHAGAEGQNCITCHDPHTGTDKFLLRGNVKKTAATQ